MKRSFLLLIFLLLFLGSCGQDYNSNYNDRGTYADIGIPAGTPLYNAYVLIQNRCFSCHSGAWQDFKTDQAWMDSGLVSKGSFDTSTLRNKLQNYGGNMPRLTSSEIDTLKTWINGL